MKVRDLVEALSKLDPEALLLVPDGEFHTMYEDYVLCPPVFRAARVRVRKRDGLAREVDAGKKAGVVAAVVVEAGP